MRRPLGAKPATPDPARLPQPPAGRQILPPDFSLTLLVQKTLRVGTRDAPPAEIVKGDGNPLLGKPNSAPVSRLLVQIQSQNTERDRLTRWYLQKVSHLLPFFKINSNSLRFHSGGSRRNVTRCGRRTIFQPFG